MLRFQNVIFFFSIFFIQEFREGRKASQTAPQVLYSVGEPPSELRDQPDARTGENVGYITFGKSFYNRHLDFAHGTHLITGHLHVSWDLLCLSVLFPRHTNKNARDNTINLIHTFRDYLHYHIKCSKVWVYYFLFCVLRFCLTSFCELYTFCSFTSNIFMP